MQRAERSTSKQCITPSRLTGRLNKGGLKEKAPDSSSTLRWREEEEMKMKYRRSHIIDISGTALFSLATAPAGPYVSPLALGKLGQHIRRSEY